MSRNASNVLMALVALTLLNCSGEIHSSTGSSGGVGYGNGGGKTDGSAGAGEGGGTTHSGGTSGAGGAQSLGGTTAASTGSSGGAGGKGGVGGANDSGGMSSSGGTLSTGGIHGSGGTVNAGNGGTAVAIASGGTNTTGGRATTGGAATGTGGKSGIGGTTSTGGATGAGGTSGAGNSTGTVVNGCPVRMEGWAELAGTTGGGDAAPQKVASVADLRTLSKDETPRVLQLEGTYDLGATYLAVGSNKTFIGIGKNVVIKAAVAGFSLRHSHNVILRNFTVNGGGDVGTEGGDAITATVAERLWFDHLTVTDGPDGILDLTQGTTNATVSWCKIYYTSASQPHRYAMQFSSGSGSGSTDKGKLDITMHHNWFGDLVNQRMPRHLWGKGHIYNSYYNSPGNEYCIGAGSLASLLIENNYFKDVVDPYRLQDDGPVHIVASGNIFDNATGKQESGALGAGAAGSSPGPWFPTYKYSLDDAKSVPDLVKRCAGPQ